MPRVQLSILGLLCLAAVCPAQQPPTFSYYVIPPAPGGHPPSPERIVAGPDGNLWFTSTPGNPYDPQQVIGRVTTNGVITLIPAPSGQGVTVGPDGNLWYLYPWDTWVVRFNPSTYEAAPFNLSGSAGGGIVAGPDGKLWYTAGSSNIFSDDRAIGRITTAGVADGIFPLNVGGGYSSPDRIVVGADGNLWVEDAAWFQVDQVIPRVTSDGTVTRYSLNNGYAVGVTNLTPGPDGRLWFDVGTFSCSLAAMTIGGVVTYYSSCLAGGKMTTGPDGYLWAYAAYGSAGVPGIAKFNAAGGSSFFPFPGQWGAIDMTIGRDGCLWMLGNIVTYGPTYVTKACPAGPRITSVSSTNPNGVYLTGATLDITVTFDSAVTVTGTPQLTLNSGGIATYLYGSGTNTVTFLYTVGAGDTALCVDAAKAAALRYTNPAGPVVAISLNGGTIRDASGNDAIIMVPVAPNAGALGTNKQIAVNPPDAAPPVSTATLSPAPNGNGWNNSDVTVYIYAGDNGGSGVRQIQYALSGAQNAGPLVGPGNTATVAVNVEGITTITYFATDNVGNVEAANTLYIRLDRTLPGIALVSRLPSPDMNGWNNTDVTVTWSCTDVRSGPVSTTVTQAVSAQGAGQSATGTCTDLAGNAVSSTVMGISIDKKDLTIQLTHAGGGGHFSQGQQGATYTISVNNVGQLANSGLVTVTDTFPVGLTPVSMSGLGWICPGTAANNCTRSDGLAAGTAYPPILVTVDVALDAPMTVTNTATVSGEGELNTTNDTAADPATVNPIVEVTNLVRVTQTGFLRNRVTGIWFSTLTVKNISATPISGPLQLVLEYIGSNVTLVNRNGMRNGDPYLTVSSGPLAPGASVSVTLQCLNPSNGFINYTAEVDSGVF
jgi:uncharacterized repeat protein (TIGR01451 family)